jgi:hypothetical protein
MNGNTAPAGLVRVLAFNLALLAASPSLAGGEVTITRTNWLERWITNVIDVRMPLNRFVDEYHTNWITQIHTNIVDVPVTNWTKVNQTNRVEVAASWTNHVTACHTNWITRTLTNHVTFDLTQTNFVDRHQTNWTTLNLTNWETLVLLKTNWITRQVTNLVQLDLPSRPAPPAAGPGETADPRETPPDTPLLPPAKWGGRLAIEAARTTRLPANDLVEVELKVRWTDNTPGPAQVDQWRVQREDGAVVLFGQDQQFKRSLPAGKYKVEAKLKAEGDNPPLSVRGTLSVTPNDANIQPRLLVKK